MSKKKQSNAYLISCTDIMDSEENHPILQLSLISLHVRALFKRQQFSVVAELLYFKTMRPLRRHTLIFLCPEVLKYDFFYLHKDGNRSAVFKCDNLVSQCAFHGVSPPTGPKSQYLHLV